jgi:Ser/Thr protein kinase RdoA (MazF antagonist)
MEPSIRDRFNDAILQKAMRLYAIAKGQLAELDGFENFVYEYQRDGRHLILRIAHSSRRTAGMVEGEVDWLSYLHDRGAGVHQVAPSANGRLLEVIDDGQGGQFVTTAFVKVAGTPPWEMERTDVYWERYGRAIGRLHALTKDYQPPPGRGRRPQWDDEILQDVQRNLPATESAAVARYEAAFQAVCDLPRDRESYGLVHFDAHQANLLVDDEGAIILFDFDDCAYAWFAYDIAVVILHVTATLEDRESFTARFLPPFLRGYSRENTLDGRWLHELPHFLKLREIDLYAVIHRSFDVQNLDDWWCERFMDGRKQRIELGVPTVDVDLGSLGRYL